MKAGPAISMSMRVHLCLGAPHHLLLRATAFHAEAFTILLHRTTSRGHTEGDMAKSSGSSPSLSSQGCTRSLGAALNAAPAIGLQLALSRQLDALASALQLLTHRLGSSLRSDSLLQTMLYCCNDSCKEVRRLIELHMSQSPAADTAEAWVNLSYLGGTTNHFTQLLAAYTATLQIVLAGAHRYE